MIDAAVLLAAAAVGLSTAAVAYVRGLRAERSRRRDVLADCRDLLEGAAPAETPSGFGALRGRYDGRAASLTPIAEALAFRRLPQLWIAAALRREGGEGAFEIVRRPTGAEFFAGGANLPRTIAPPPSWPQDTRVACDPAGAALLRRLEALLAPALVDPRLKVVTATPSGVRVVRQAAQGKRAAYLLFRDAKFETDRAPPMEAAAALELAAAIARALPNEAETDVRDAA